MAHQTSVAPKRSEWVAVRVCAVVLAMLQSGQAARLFAAGHTRSAVLVMICATVGAALGILSLLRPTYSDGASDPANPSSPPAATLTRWDWKVNAALAGFFLSVAIAGIGRHGGLWSVGAIVGLLGFALTLVLAVLQVRHHRHPA